MNSLRAVFLATLVLPGSVHAADTPAYLGEESCRIAPLKPEPKHGKLAWSGGCKDGFAEGKGTLEWRTGEKKPRRIEATLARGEIVGEATLTYEGGTYIGSFMNGMPHGAGYFKYANGKGLYEGGVADGTREGTGVQITSDRSTYEGGWKAGKRHGFGKAVFALGGSYEGEWRDNRFNGKGRLVHAGSGRVYEGEFRDGRPLGAAARPSDELDRFALKDDRPKAGSRIHGDRAIGFTPLDAEWAQLTPEQQDQVRGSYPALDERDEPPYPLGGTRAFYKAAADVYRKFTDYEGDTLVYVMVGADGVPKTASVIGAPHPEMGRYLSMVAMAQRFKPAMCAGKPCDMIYPVSFKFYVE